MSAVCQCGTWRLNNLALFSVNFLTAEAPDVLNVLLFGKC